MHRICSSHVCTVRLMPKRSWMGNVERTLAEYLTPMAQASIYDDEDSCPLLSSHNFVAARWRTLPDIVSGNGGEPTAATASSFIDDSSRGDRHKILRTT